MGEEEPLSRDLAARVIDHFPGGFLAVLDCTFRIRKIWGRGLEQLKVSAGDLEDELLTAHPLFDPSADITLALRQAIESGEQTIEVILGEIPHRLFISTIQEPDKPLWIMLAARNITNEVRYEKFARLLLNASDQTEESIMITDAMLELPGPRILYVNRGFERMTGYRMNEIAGKTPRILQGPRTDEAVLADLKARLKEKKRFEGETWNYRKNGEPFLLHWTIDPVVNENEELTHFISVQRDVTADRDRDNRLQQTLKEREILLAEVHHRVKNNLALVSALLFLQLERTENREAFEALSDSANRIQSIALIHEMLYQSNNFARIPIPVFIERLSEKILDTYLESGQEISLLQQINEDLRISIEQAVPVGLIINELISNSVSHGFCNLLKGTISVELNRNDTLYRLYYRDDGHGIPGHINLEEDHRLGFMLIKTLARQLDGKYRLSVPTSGKDQPGFEFELCFPAAPEDI